MNQLNTAHKEIGFFIEKILSAQLPNDLLREGHLYAVCPPGKLFRPMLVWAILQDTLSSNSQTNWTVEHPNHALFAAALEIHHAYTLVHDDMPCMDNDDYRRGRLSTHKKFGQWQALLIGDGLLNISYQLIAKIDCPQSTLLKIMSWALGPKGLILGQALDLSGEMAKSFSSLYRTHELKTGRLIQLSILGSYLLAEAHINLKTAKNLARLGQSMGLVFQFLDDLTELAVSEISEHEAQIGPWFHHPKQTYETLTAHLIRLKSLTTEYKLTHFQAVLRTYFDKINHTLDSGETFILKHIKEQTSEGLSLEELLKIQGLLKI